MYAKKIVVTRHPAVVEWLAKELGWTRAALGLCDETGKHVPVLGSVEADDIRGAIVYGNLPLWGAALADLVYVIEFDGIPPRGLEYDAQDMYAAGARLSGYSVSVVEETEESTEAEASRYESDENAVEIDHESGIYRTYTRGTRNPLYVGDDEAAARESLEMSPHDWVGLVSSDPAND